MPDVACPLRLNFFPVSVNPSPFVVLFPCGIPDHTSGIRSVAPALKSPRAPFVSAPYSGLAYKNGALADVLVTIRFPLGNW